MNDDAFLPIALRLDDAEILIVGGGGIAANKARLVLSRAPGRLHVIARALEGEMAAWHAEGRFDLAGRDVTAEALDALMPRLRAVFAATNDARANRLVAERAHAHGVLVCAVDDPEPSSFITPAIIDRRPVQIAISTGGAAPVLARRLRFQVEALLPDGLGRLARFMRLQRPAMRAALPEIPPRRRAWEDFLDGPGQEAALIGNDAQARAALTAAMQGQSGAGEAWLVGAGPGDPDMLTLGALRLMQNCDSVLYDRLIPDAIMDRVRRDAERVFVGKRMSRHALPQPEINAEMIRRARSGERVLRLKGGDPFIFGRGGEEMEALLEAGVRVRVVPGITAASGCGAAAGIPLTHRDCAQICVLLTGHARADGTLDLDWPNLARRGQTLVIYMGLTPIGELCAQLMTHGLPPDWPAAIIAHGTLADQRVHAGTLATLEALTRERGVRSPALTIVGEVVRHRGELQ